MKNNVKKLLVILILIISYIVINLMCGKDVLAVSQTTSATTTKSTEARLSNLGIKPNDFSGFRRDKTEYNTEVPNNVSEVEVYAQTVDKNAKVTGTGKVQLKEGKNTVKVTVTAEDGKTTKTYTLAVKRKASEEAEGTTVEQFGLLTLSINELNLNQDFKVNTYEYTATLEEDLDSLDIQAKANKENAIVEIIGNENLQQGENIITILVTNTKTEEVVTYQIMINKNLTKGEIVENSWLKPSTWGKEEKNKIVIIVVLIILIISAIILKIKLTKENKKERNLPGAEELDKAIAEHQELSAENNEQISDKKGIFRYENEQNYIQDIAKNRLGIEDSKEDFEEKTRRRGKHF